MKTHDPRVRVANHGHEDWRTEVQDEPGAEWSITGPPYPTRTEALLHVDYAAWIAFGTPMPAQSPVADSGFDPAFAIHRLTQARERLEHFPRAARDGQLDAVLRSLADELGMVVYTRPVYAVTRPMLEELAGREVTDEEAARIGRCIEHSTVGECIGGAVEQVCGLPDDDEDDPDGTYTEDDRGN